MLKSRSLTGNLPAATASFIDRRQETTEIKRRLSTHRLVTLTGAAGVGKTRLGLHVARDDEVVLLPIPASAMEERP